MIEMSDKDIRRILQKRGYFFANSTEHGPAHISEGSHTYGICGAMIDTHLPRRATNMCKHCRKIAVKQIAAAEQS